MRDNFIRCAAVSPDVTVADPLANELSIKAYMDEAAKNNVSVLVFPELCLTGRLKIGRASCRERV